MFITKYAISCGITSPGPKCTRRQDENGDYLWDGWTILRFGRDVFDSREEAVRDAEKRRDKKVASLRKQLNKVEEMTFTA